jgi:hypothetical protein
MGIAVARRIGSLLPTLLLADREEELEPTL